MKVRKGSSTEYILIALEASVNGIVSYLEFIKKLQSYGSGKGYGWEIPMKKGGLTKAIKRMRDRGLVEFENDKLDKVFVKLTSLGKNYLDDLSGSEEEWDGNWRIVMFDVPEAKSAIRNLLRRRLKDWGFIQWQRSVWVSKKNVTRKLRDMVTKLEIDNWVVVIETTDPAIETLMKRSYQ